ncbi:MAG: Spy/CpxP family protein refolding chaperone [Gammaproteobacteria bacterium]|nr:Spy/CpxP family protein refolding chaperone [Gammaproteobacteria bacterium]
MKIHTLSIMLLSLFLSQPLFAALDTPITQQPSNIPVPKQDSPSHCPQTCDCTAMKMQNGLALTAQQKQKILQIHAAYQNQLQLSKEALSITKEQIRTITKAKTMDKASLDILIQKQIELTGERIRIKAMVRNKIYNVLNAEQKLRFNQMEHDWLEYKSQ